MKVSNEQLPQENAKTKHRNLVHKQGKFSSSVWIIFIAFSIQTKYRTLTIHAMACSHTYIGTKEIFWRCSQRRSKIQMFSEQARKKQRNPLTRLQEQKPGGGQRGGKPSFPYGWREGPCLDWLAPIVARLFPQLETLTTGCDLYFCLKISWPRFPKLEEREH